MGSNPKMMISIINYILGEFEKFFQNAGFFKFICYLVGIAYISNQNIVFNLYFSISELGDFKTIKSASTHQIDNSGEILDIRVDLIGYSRNEKPDTQEFYKRVKAEIVCSLL